MLQPTCQLITVCRRPGRANNTQRDTQGKQCSSANVSEASVQGSPARLCQAVTGMSSVYLSTCKAHCCLVHQCIVNLRNNVRTPAPNGKQGHMLKGCNSCHQTPKHLRPRPLCMAGKVKEDIGSASTLVTSLYRNNTSKPVLSNVYVSAW